MQKRIAVYGSTGSIGTQALEVIREYATELKIAVLVGGNNYNLLIAQAVEFVPHVVVIANSNHYAIVNEALQNYPIQVYGGEQALVEVAEMDIYDIMLSAIVGFSGMRSTLAALTSGKPVALANKESLVVAGNLMMKAAATHQAAIIPVDSEHSAIFQCLAGVAIPDVRKIILTASGGALREYSKAQLRQASVQQALHHPTWKMGNKITIDSASLMNKGLEMIEAKWLFGLNPSQIEAVIHPESIIHSMVELIDGNVLAQLSVPDMRLPIAHALLFPKRRKASWERFNPLTASPLTFSEVDELRFPNISLAKEAMRKGGNMPCILNAANEVAVAAYIKGSISFYGMSDLIARCMASMPYISESNLVDYLECDKETRNFAHSQNLADFLF